VNKWTRQYIYIYIVKIESVSVKYIRKGGKKTRKEIEKWRKREIDK